MKHKLFYTFILTGLTILIALGAHDRQVRIATSHAVSIPQSPIDSPAKKNFETLESSRKTYLSELPPIPKLPPQPELKTFKDTLAISRKALRSSAETLVYHQALQDMVMIQMAKAVLSEIHEPASDESFRNDQKERMNAALFLCRAIEWTENPIGPQIKQIIQDLVLDDTIEHAHDPRLKKSMAADRIELFANLKSIDPEAGRLIQSSAKKASSIKLIQFANNFYDLNNEKRGHL